MEKGSPVARPRWSSLASDPSGARSFQQVIDEANVGEIVEARAR